MSSPPNPEPEAPATPRAPSGAESGDTPPEPPASPKSAITGTSTGEKKKGGSSHSSSSKKDTTTTTTTSEDATSKTSPSSPSNAAGGSSTTGSGEGKDGAPEAPAPPKAPSLAAAFSRPELHGMEKFKHELKIWANKGNLSNLFTFIFFLFGLVLINTLPEEEDGRNNQFASYVLSFGLFGFAGGITNWLAIKMLFDKIPGLYGSGIIPARFKEIRETVKNTMLRTFFDPAFLENYITNKAGDLLGKMDVDSKITQLLESEAFDQVIDVKLADLATKPEGMWLAMMGINPTSLKPMIKPFLSNMGSDLVPLLTSSFKPGSMMDINRVRDEIDKLMTKKLEELTPDIVKRLMEDVMRKHLGWLIVWGNVFGGLIGVLTKASGLGDAL